MKIEDQLVSLELAKKLKALNVKQDSYFHWYTEHREFPHKITHLKPLYRTDNHTNSFVEFYSAFTVAELAEILPKTTWECGNYLQGNYWCWYYKTEDVNELLTADTLANAMAKMLCYLLENKLLK